MAKDTPDTIIADYHAAYARVYSLPMVQIVRYRNGWFQAVIAYKNGGEIILGSYRRAEMLAMTARLNERAAA